MRNDKYLWVTASRPKPGKEEEYNRWYDQHVATFFKFPGLKRVCRNRCIHPLSSVINAQYLTLYEFEDKESLEAFSKVRRWRSPKRNTRKDGKRLVKHYGQAGGSRQLRWRE